MAGPFAFRSAARSHNVSVVYGVDGGIIKGMGSLLDIGHLLVHARQKRGMSQRELGEAVGVKQQQVARWETSAYRTASLERVSRVAEVLDVGPVRKRRQQEGQAATADQSPAAHAPSSTPVTAARSGPVSDLDEIAARVREHGPVLAERYRVVSIDVFGAFARGEQSDTSFVGLIVELEEPTLPVMIDSEVYLQEVLGRRVQAGPLTSISEGIRTEVESERVRVWPI